MSALLLLIVVPGVNLLAQQDLAEKAKPAMSSPAKVPAIKTF
jgi:hypothetical protein